MKRKLIKQGRSGMTVYLPKKWVDARGLGAGDEVDMSEEGPRLVLGAEKKAEIRSVERDVSGLDKASIHNIFTALYESGYDEITFRFKRNVSIDYMKDKRVRVSEVLVSLVPQFHGFEIVSHGDDYYTVRDISQSSERDFDVVLRRIFFLLLEFDKYIQEGVASGRKKYDQGTERYNNIVKFVSYCLRLLNKRQVPDAEKYNLYEVINSLDDIALYYRFMADDLQKVKLSDGSEGMVKKIGVVLRKFYDFAYQVDNDKLKELNRLIAEIERKLLAVQLKQKEFQAVYHFSTVLDVIDANMKCLLSLKAISERS